MLPMRGVIMILNIVVKKKIAQHIVPKIPKVEVILGDTYVSLLRWESVGSPHRLAWYWLQILKKLTKIQVREFVLK